MNSDTTDINAKLKFSESATCTQKSWNLRRLGNINRTNYQINDAYHTKNPSNKDNKVKKAKEDQTVCLNPYFQLLSHSL